MAVLQLISSFPLPELKLLLFQGIGISLGLDEHLPEGGRLKFRFYLHLLALFTDRVSSIDRLLLIKG